MTTKLQGVKIALEKLQHGLDVHSDKLMKRIAQTEVRSDQVFKDADAKIALHMDAHLDEVNEFLDELEKSNGGPTLDDSSGSSEPSAEREPENGSADGFHPQASWAGK